jgi:ribose 5-phosphate isomerase B
MRIALGADHGGYHLKVQIAAHLAGLGHDVVDLGTHSEEPVDYPDYGVAVGRAVTDGTAELGVCVCGSGIGIAIAANKLPGVYAAVVHDVTTGHLARTHNHANVICLGERVTGPEVAKEAVDAFLAATPATGRHARRVELIADIESAAMEGARP